MFHMPPADVRRTAFATGAAVARGQSRYWVLGRAAGRGVRRAARAVGRSAPAGGEQCAVCGLRQKSTGVSTWAPPPASR